MVVQRQATARLRDGGVVGFWFKHRGSAGDRPDANPEGDGVELDCLKTARRWLANRGPVSETERGWLNASKKLFDEAPLPVFRQFSHLTS
ncbi:hypothetical protein [Streptomyces sp. NA13]|uniref:hypothetical protein n=1 Tax=Streptomyces sp. NA13 TaxID=2996051 RepID=UPI00226EDA70|nr:hypothetical protein [Streptomyces sp. NA13]WAD00571.1 hypothetical protein OSU72_30915 [Streptomyces sp. NA13]